MTIAMTMTMQSMAVMAMPKSARERKESVRMEMRTGMAEAAKSCTHAITHHSERVHATRLCRPRQDVMLAVMYNPFFPPPPTPPLAAKTSCVASLDIYSALKKCRSTRVHGTTKPMIEKMLKSLVMMSSLI